MGEKWRENYGEGVRSPTPNGGMRIGLSLHPHPTHPQVATDFVSPDHVAHVCRLAADRRLLPPTHGRKADVLGYETLLFNAACAAAHAIQNAAQPVPPAAP
jgi:hypothetical protein